MATNMMELSAQWASRPADQRFLSLDALAEHVGKRRGESWTTAMRARDLRILPAGNGLAVHVLDRARNETRALTPTHWSFGQLAQLAGAPGAYLRKLPAELAAICAQWGLEHAAERDEALVFARSNGEHVVRSFTSTTYGRIWDADVVAAVQRATAGGNWKVPAASYSARDPMRATTLYASDRDVWLFLCDPDHAIEVPGEPEPLFRGFMVWNSETGAATFGLRTFLYRRVCDNRIVWGATDVSELTIRHTGGAPERFAYEGGKLLSRYAEESTVATVAAIKGARETVLQEPDGSRADVRSWLKSRGFSASVADASVKAAEREEGDARTLWQIVQGVTAHARTVEHTDTRVELEARAGKLLDSVK
jgi:hypothetical protein